MAPKIRLDEVLAEVQEAYADLPRPEMFIRGTCKCSECLEHEQEMQSFSPQDLPFEKLNNPGWDPICFASDEAFAYLVPGLVKLALNPANEYVSQFVFHLNCSGRIDIFTKRQTKALIRVLDYLSENFEMFEALWMGHDIDDLRNRLESVG